MDANVFNHKVSFVTNLACIHCIGSQSLVLYFHFSSQGEFSQENEYLTCLIEDLQETLPCKILLGDDVSCDPNIVIRYTINHFPKLLFLKKGNEIGRINFNEGLVTATEIHEIYMRKVGEISHTAPKERSVLSLIDDKTRCSIFQDIVDTHMLVIFIKGTKELPMCKYSRRAIEILNSLDDIKYIAWNVLSEPLLLQHISKLSGYDKFPQLYLGGEFLGGVERMTEMVHSGLLKRLIEEALKRTGSEEEILYRFIVNSAECVILIRGTIAQPGCGKSKRVVDWLRSINVHPDFLDVEYDEDLSRGIIQYFNPHEGGTHEGWEPHVFVGGSYAADYTEMKSVISSSGYQGLRKLLRLTE